MSTLDNLATSRKSESAYVEERYIAGESLAWRWLKRGMMVVLAIIMLLPFFWLVSSSLKTQTEIFAYPPQWIPDPVRFENYTEALSIRPFYLYFRNTMIVVTLNVIAVVLSSSFVAYGFARMRFPGRDFWFGVVLATLFLPYAITIVPSFIIFTRLGWVNTFLPLVVPPFFGGGAFNIFLMRQFFRTIPDELTDAARIDGASEFGIYWRIMMPLSKPALITVGLFTFLAAWNDLLGPLIYLRNPDLFTVAVGLASFRSILDVSWHYQLAAATAMILPVTVLFFIAQKYFIQGIVMTGLKG